MVIAGDPSGDLHTAPILRKLKKLQPDCNLYGIGGPAMQKVGFTALYPFEPFNRMGYAEVIRHLGFFLKVKKQLIAHMKVHPPACLLCVDYSGFNIPMMKAAHALGIPVIWYIAPMVWAWKRKRAAILARYAAHICCIFPFEVPYFKAYTNHVSFVGNPLVESRATAISGTQLKQRTLPEKPVLAIIPGSRTQEINRLLPPMVGAYKLLKLRFPNLSCMVSRYHLFPESVMQKLLGDSDATIFSGTFNELLSQTDIALVTSGTATLETALMGVPHVIAYATSPLTYAIINHLVSLPNVGLPNIIAGKIVAPECIQQYVTEGNLAEQLSRFLSSADYYSKTAEALLQIRMLLGSKQPSIEVASHILRSVSH